LEDERALIWSAFGRGTAAKSTGAGGSGIGLSVVKDLVGRHGGSVWVESARGGGACFVVEFLRAAQRADAEPAPAMATTSEIR
jgi:signal transduction histidine kinase